MFHQISSIENFSDKIEGARYLDERLYQRFDIQWNSDISNLLGKLNLV